MPERGRQEGEVEVGGPVSGAGQLRRYSAHGVSLGFDAGFGLGRSLPVRLADGFEELDEAIHVGTVVSPITEFCGVNGR